MAGTNERGKKVDSEGEIWQAISAFEQILEVMPEDRSSLETLSHAYEHVGDHAKGLEYLKRLARVVLQEQDAETAQDLVERLDEYAGSDDQVQALRDELATLGQAHTPTPPGTGADTEQPQQPSLKAGEKDRTAFRVTDELSFAWKLFEAGEISQEDYATVAHDLAELSVDPHPSTASVLHVLETHAYSGMERVMGYASRETKTPILSLAAFQVGPDTAAALPLDFTIRRGALVFGTILDELLVAVLNPYDQTLREDVIHETGCTCHFFLALPSEFDDAVAEIKAGE